MLLISAVETFRCRVSFTVWGRSLMVMPTTGQPASKF
jgi:hypothetical protein